MGTSTVTPKRVNEALYTSPEENKPYRGRNISAHVMILTNESSSNLFMDIRSVQWWIINYKRATDPKWLAEHRV